MYCSQLVYEKASKTFNSGMEKIVVKNLVDQLKQI